ncbi:MAG: beta-ketoacyl synthase N-terminal-like domain-containing protein, partial [Terriglobales bacterium]
MSVTDSQAKPHTPPQPIAIVGMECIFPGARDLAAFWRNIVLGVDATQEVPESRWDPRPYGLTGARGGFLDGLTDFDPLPLGVMPASVEQGDAEQFLVLAVIHRALLDAETGRARQGVSPVLSRRESPERTEVVVGRGGYLGNALEHLHLRSEVVAQVSELLARLSEQPSHEQAEQIRRKLLAALPAVTAETVAGTIPNLNCGRVANRLDFMGAGYTVDAACASALIALDRVLESLRERRCDLGIAAAVHLVQKPYFWDAFATLNALSRTGRSRSFAADADGLVVAEGLGALALKRLSDAERDGDRIYAVVRGVGVASDGRGTGILTPRREGEVLAMRRAYEQTDIDPATVSLVEGHGTATTVGDATEIAAMHEVFGREGIPSVALGSVKSMIGHAMPASGMASLIKTALALYHRILPPTIHVDRPHPELAGSRIYVNTITRPWIMGPGAPRRAAVSAFGFGGINAHALLEEPAESDSWRSLTPQSSELFLLSAPSRQELLQKTRVWKVAAAAFGATGLRDACYTEALRFSSSHSQRLAIVAANAADLAAKLGRVEARLSMDAAEHWFESDGIYFSASSYPGKLAVLFPGIGFPGLAGGYARRLGELCLHFPEARRYMDQADGYTAEDPAPYPFRHQLFPPPLLDPGPVAQLEKELAWSERAPIGMMMANLATFDMVKGLGIQPAAVTGFSLGEWPALVAAGVIQRNAMDRETFLRSRAVLNAYDETSEDRKGMWAVVAASAEQVEALLHHVPGIVNVTMDVSPTQVFIGGEVSAVRTALQQLQKLGVWGQELPVVPVHTPLADSFTARLRSVLAGVPFQTPEHPVYCGMSARPYPAEPEEIRRLLLESISKPVHIRETISQLYRDGVRIFLQLGGGGKLLTNIQSTLALHPHIALSIDREHRGGLEQFQHVVGRLAVLGVALNPAALYRNRVCAEIAPESPAPPKPGRQLSLASPRLRPSDETIREIRALMGSLQALPVPSPRMPESGPAFVSSAPASRAAPQPLAEVMSTLDRFLELQRQEEEAEAQVFARFLETQQAALMAMTSATRPVSAAVADAPIAPPPAKAAPAHQHPLIGEIQRWIPGKEFESRLVLDLDAHPFLAHHALIRVPDSLRPLEERLPTLPMTFEAEILAEAAALLAPEMTLICCHDLEASRWVSLEDSRQLPVNILGRRISSSEVEVELRTPGSERPAFRGKATVGPASPMVPTPMEIHVDRPCPTSAADFYSHGPLFHGPMFHVITALNGMSENTIAAELRVSDPGQLFATPPVEAPVFDPVLLDGLGQVVA